MKNPILKLCLLLVVMSLLVADADAQGRRSRRRGDTSGNEGQTTPNQQQQNNNTQRPAYNPYGNVPIEVAPTTGGYSDSIKKSMRPDAAFDKSFINDRTPLPYEHLRWDDALFAEKVWREIDLREKINISFRYNAEDDNGSQKFINILLKAVKNGDVTAFDASDDRFTTPLDLAAINQQISGGAVADTQAVYDLNDPTKITKYVVTSTAFNPDDVMKFRLKEEWVFDREASRMFVRILGIAPLKTSYRPDGTERGSAPMFWVYYPDLRPILAKYEVYNPKNMGNGRMTWEELFESRMFSSYIVKSTLDNPSNRNIRNMIKDPILQLLEGENIKERIFNYEQDLWSY
ncbi:MAG: gliding motility protein GldN [Flavisolibacter sp.]|nr:gliding motility protein GldN [Flavisolibacter sp.]